MASSETATMTALPASSTGMPAAISAPNTAISRISVIGTEVSSALRKSWLISVLAARSVLASPASATIRPRVAGLHPGDRGQVRADRGCPPGRAGRRPGT